MYVQSRRSDPSVFIQEFNKVPMFMKTAPEEIDRREYPELACLQAIIHDEDRPPEGTTAAPQLCLAFIFPSNQATVCVFASFFLRAGKEPER